MLGVMRVAEETQRPGGFPHLRALHIAQNLLPGQILKDAQEHFDCDFTRRVFVEFGRPGDQQLGGAGAAD
jgi:hypothetical protein